MNSRKLTIREVKRKGKPTRIEVMTQEDMRKIHEREDRIETIVLSVVIGLAIAGIFALGIAITPSGWA